MKIKNIQDNLNALNTVYFKGDLCIYTGEPAEKIHGGTYYKYVYAEGHKKGEELVITEEHHLRKKVTS